MAARDARDAGGAGKGSGSKLTLYSSFSLIRLTLLVDNGVEDSGLSESCALSSRYGCRVPPIKMKKTIAFSFFAGIVAGAVFAPGWRTAARKGIKAGIKGGRKIREFSQQAMEDLEDVAAEAANELAEEDRKEEERQS